MNRFALPGLILVITLTGCSGVTSNAQEQGVASQSSASQSAVKATNSARPTPVASGSPESVAPAIDGATATRLLALADKAARGCSGKAFSVQVARSTNDVATAKVLEGRVFDHRPVWAILVSGDAFACPHSGPPGSSHIAHVTNFIELIDASTFKETAFGSAPDQSLTPIGPVAVLR